METVIWPKPKNKTVQTVLERLRTLYGLDLNYDEYIEWSARISVKEEGDNYFLIHSLFVKDVGTFFALYIKQTWVAVQRARGAKHIGKVLDPSVLDDFRDNKLHYRRPEGREVFHMARATAIARLDFEFFTIAEWIEFCERIRRWPDMPGVRKLVELGEGQEIWTVNKKGLFWIACIWDRNTKYITELLDREVLVEAGIDEIPD